MAFATTSEGCSLFQRVGHVVFLFLHRFFVHQGTDVGIINPLAHSQCLRRRNKTGAELVIDGAFNKDAVGPEAILPGGGKFCLDRFGHRAVQIAVFKDNDRGMTAQFHHQTFDRLGGLAIKQLANLGRAGERQGPHPRVPCPWLNHHRGFARNHVEHALGDARAFRKLGQCQRAERCFTRRMRHNGATCRQRGCGLAGQHRGRKVPRRDQCGHAHRFAPQLHLGIGQMAGDTLDIGAFGFLGVEFDKGRAIFDLAACLRERLALLQHHQAGEVFFVFDHQFKPATQDGATVLRQHQCPAGKGGMRRIHRGRGILCRHCGHITDEIPGGRVMNGDNFAIR